MGYRDLGKEIVTRIKDDPELSAKIGDRIVAVISEDVIETPFITYRRAKTDYSAYKQYSVPKTITMQLDVFSRSYAESVAIADALEDLFAMKVDSDERYVQGIGYVQSLMIEMKV